MDAFKCSRGSGVRHALLPSVGACVLLAVVVAAGAACEFQAVFNFGDSNSDTGGFWAAFPAQGGPFGMTYFKRPSGRASDGRLVIDFLAQALGLPFLSPYLKSIGSNFSHGANFATLASTALLPNTSVFVTGISPFALAVQLNQMKEFKKKVLELHPHDDLPPQDVFAESLYTIDIGQNDFTSNLAAVGVTGARPYLQQVVAQIGGAIKELHEQVGGRTFLVFNLAPIGCFPAFLSQFARNDTDLDTFGCRASYNNAVDEYNTLLKEELRRTRESLPDASVVYVDTNSIKLQLFRRPRSHGLVYGTKACCGHGGGAYNFDPQVYCGNTKAANGSTVAATACHDPESYVSWDGIHTTEAANKMVALAVISGSYSQPSFPFSKYCNVQPIGM